MNNLRLIIDNSCSPTQLLRQLAAIRRIIRCAWLHDLLCLMSFCEKFIQLNIIDYHVVERALNVEEVSPRPHEFFARLNKLKQVVELTLHYLFANDTLISH